MAYRMATTEEEPIKIKGALRKPSYKLNKTKLKDKRQSPTKIVTADYKSNRGSSKNSHSIKRGNY